MPKYETENDRLNETNVLKKIQEYNDIDFGKLYGEYAKIDFWIKNNLSGKTIFAEVKCRNNAHDKYPTYFISHAKWKAGKKLATELKTKFYIIVRFTDGIYHTDETDKLDTGTRYVASGGRTDRGGVNDIEMMLHIPHNELIYLCPSF